MDIVNINQLKLQLNIESGYTGDDFLMENYLMVAVNSVYNYCDGGLSGYTISGYTSEEETDIPLEVQQAIIMVAAHLYLNRNIVSFTQSYEIPFTYRYLLDKYKKYND